MTPSGRQDSGGHELADLVGGRAEHLRSFACRDGLVQLALQFFEVFHGQHGRETSGRSRRVRGAKPAIRQKLLEAGCANVQRAPRGLNGI